MGQNTLLQLGLSQNGHKNLLQCEPVKIEIIIFVRSSQDNQKSSQVTPLLFPSPRARGPLGYDANPRKHNCGTKMRAPATTNHGRPQ